MTKRQRISAAFLFGALALAALPLAAFAQSPFPAKDFGTVGTTAKSLFSGLRPANGWEVCNPNASGDLWASDMTTAAANGAGSVRVPANGGCYLVPRFYGKSGALGAVSIIGSTASLSYTARAW